MQTTRIGILGNTKSADQLTLRLRQFQLYDFQKLQLDKKGSNSLVFSQIDVLIIICSGRNLARYYPIIQKSKEYINPKKVIILSSIKDGDLMYCAMEMGIGKFLVGDAKNEAISDRLKIEINSILQLHKTTRVLAIGAHPDDVEIGCGGSLKKHSKAGDEVMILTLTQGAQGGQKKIRVKESEYAAKSLDALLTICDLEDTNLSNGGQTIQSIETVIKAFKPTVVYTHSLNDTHQDHRATHYATLVAARQIEKIYAYLAPSGTIDFHPRYFEHIEDYMADKMDAINCFGSQTVSCARPYLTSSIIESTAEYWGRFSNYGLVEPFEVIRA